MDERSETAGTNLRRLPSVDKLLQTCAIADLIVIYGRALVVEAVRSALDQARADIRAGGQLHGEDEIVARTRAALGEIVEPTLTPVINATGVVLHTNLGRAPLSASVLEAMARVGQGFSNLEFDLTEGRRGSRYVHAESLLCRLTGAEGALLVNNNAGAVLLTLTALAQHREVVISRGNLIEIGGGFRIPDVMAQSGAHLVEVGTTNRTYVRDYVSAIGEDTAALMRAHTSNFRIVGFAHEPTLSDLVAPAHERDVLVFDDLGSGTLLDTAQFGLVHEPTVQESVAQGADLVTFSGDKLLGGPQAGIIVGRGELIARLRRHPMTRALRVDKTTIAGIQANLLHYVRGEALERIPIWRMIAAAADDIADRATTLLRDLGACAEGCDVWPGLSMIGGGSLPGESLETRLIALPGGLPDKMARALRHGAPPVVTRIQDNRVVLDLRTVLPGQETQLASRLRETL